MAMTEDNPADEGLRERKKRRTRREISDVATRLFAERGFDAVTLAEIAEAAEVSVKTIFNHFGSKEDLYFDRAGELRDALVSTIAGRPPGTTILGAMRALLVDNLVPFPGRGWDGLDDAEGYAAFRGFVVTQDGSAALRARRLTIGEELGEAMGAAIAADLGRRADDPAVRALAGMLVAVLNVRDRVLRTAIAGGAPPDELRRRVVAVVEEAFDRLEGGFAAVDRRA